jgi:hypothetical protein
MKIAHRFRQYWRQQTSLGYALAQGSPRAARKNILHAVGLVMLFNISIFIALLAWSLWPLIFGLLFFTSLVQRSALQARHSTHIPTRLLHGVHTHVSQIPIFIGQLNYRTRRRKK